MFSKTKAIADDYLQTKSLEEIVDSKNEFEAHAHTKMSYAMSNMGIKLIDSQFVFNYKNKTMVSQKELEDVENSIKEAVFSAQRILENKLDEYQEVPRNLERKVRVLEGEISSLYKSNEELAKVLDVGLSEIKQDIDRLKQTIAKEKYNERLYKIEEELDKLQHAVDNQSEVEERLLRDVYSAIYELEKKIDAIKGVSAEEIDTIEGKIEQLTSAVEKARSGITRDELIDILNTIFKGRENAIKELSEKYGDGLGNLVSAFDPRLDENKVKSYFRRTFEQILRGVEDEFGPIVN